MTIRRQHLLASTLLTAAAVFAGVPQLAFAQEQTAQQQAEAATEVGEVVVTGTRIPKNEFTAAQPVQVITSERAQASGVVDTVQFLQNSTVAAGSPQVNPLISSAFVTNGGPGAATVSLRGLGANRTLVLLNGRRAGPAGTRGGVSSFDLNAIPESAISRVDILKDGASSVYGSDAIAGVVNIITNTRKDGGEFSAFYTAPFDTGGDQEDFALTWGKKFERGHFLATIDYYKQYGQTWGERSFTACAENVIYNPTTGARADFVDPRTGKFSCQENGGLWGHVWLYDYTDAAFAADAAGRALAGRYQFDYDHNLGQFIPPVPPAFAGHPNGDGTYSGPYPQAPAGFFLVGQDAASYPLQNANHPFQLQQSLIPDLTRKTFYADGSFELTPAVELYSEVLLNRRESATANYRQFWVYQYTQDFGDYFGDPGFGDPFNVGFKGPFGLSPTIPTNWYRHSQTVDYTRGVLGARGDFSISFLKNWNWDLFGQYSRSDGDYFKDIILDEAIQSQSLRYGDTIASVSCVGTTLPISGRPCMDINWTDPRILAGDFNDAEKAFLYDTDTGNTLYVQRYVEGSVAGNLFSLPAGPLGVALGFHLQQDKINDVPGPATLAGNVWGDTSAGITRGKDTTTEYFGEVSIPVLRDRPFFNLLGVTLSGRYTDVKTSGNAETYKVGLNWQVTPAWKVRYTKGTSFRAPALFELYLADQSDFVSQRTVDPCLNWAANLAGGIITQGLANNCSDPNGPGGGVPGAHTGSGSSAEIHTRGGLGFLEPETSSSMVVGLIWTPKFADFSLAVDYFEIVVKNEVNTFGTGVVSACYTSTNFPTDPLCNLFVRNPSSHRIDLINDRYINISRQENRGIDATVRYRHPLPYATDLTLDGQFTWQLENNQEIFPGNLQDFNHRVGYPQFVGNLDADFHHGPWTLTYGAQMIGEQNDYQDLVDNGTITTDNLITQFGVQYRVKADAEFKSFHHVSLRRDWKDWSFLFGISNLYDTKPPSLTTLQSRLGHNDNVGAVLSASQYTEGYFGRRAFARISKKF